jgi:hypothetical protein
MRDNGNRYASIALYGHALNKYATAIELLQLFPASIDEGDGVTR